MATYATISSSLTSAKWTVVGGSCRGRHLGRSRCRAASDRCAARRSGRASLCQRRTRASSASAGIPSASPSSSSTKSQPSTSAPGRYRRRWPGHGRALELGDGRASSAGGSPLELGTRRRLRDDHHRPDVGAAQGREGGRGTGRARTRVVTGDPARRAAGRGRASPRSSAARWKALRSKSSPCRAADVVAGLEPDPLADLVRRRLPRPAEVAVASRSRRTSGSIWLWSPQELASPARGSTSRRGGSRTGCRPGSPSSRCIPMSAIRCPRVQLVRRLLRCPSGRRCVPGGSRPGGR